MNLVHFCDDSICKGYFLVFSLVLVFVSCCCSKLVRGVNRKGKKFSRKHATLASKGFKFLWNKLYPSRVDNTFHTFFDWQGLDHVKNSSIRSHLTGFSRSVSFIRYLEK